MATRNVFEFLNSNEIKTEKIDEGYVMSYHGNYKSRTYKPGAIVRFIGATDVSLYVCISESGLAPDISSDWDLLTTGLALPRGAMIDKNSLRMVDVNGDILKTI